VFVDLCIQHVLRMRRIILSVACSLISYISTLFHKGKNFQKTGAEAKIYILIFPTHFSF